MEAKSHKITVKTLQGIEEILAMELKSLGLRDIIVGRRMVTCVGHLEHIYKINLCCRTALRVLVPIETFKIKNEDDIYKHAYEINWNDYLMLNQTFAIDATINSPVIKHSKYAAYRLKDAIVDWFKELYGTRPNVDVENPHIRFNLHVSQNKVTLSLDSSGDSLHKRGYRISGGFAPVNEVMAAGMLMLADYDGSKPLSDLMTGSGTLAIEAALIASNTPPLHLRATFGFHNWQNFDEELWKYIYTEAINNKKEPESTIIANDIDPHLVDLAIDNAEAAGVGSFIEFCIGDFEQIEPKDKENVGMIVVNPPYGERIQPDEIYDLYNRLGTHFKHSFSGGVAWLLTSNLNALKKVGLKTSKRLTLFNGSLECRFVKFEMYSGSKKFKKINS